MGPSIDKKEMEKIESMVKTMDRELTPVEAKVVATMLQALEGTPLSSSDVQVKFKLLKAQKKLGPLLKSTKTLRSTHKDHNRWLFNYITSLNFDQFSTKK
jgi:hypothetical protein